MVLAVVLFDLDETLYPRQNGLMEAVGERIQTWLSNRLGLTSGEAIAVRRDYFRRYGTTMGGLIAEQDVDVDDYLTFVHDVPVGEYVIPDTDLRAMLLGIPLRKAVYTNATSEYSWRVLRALGVAESFECVIGVEETGMRNKPCRDGYEYVLAVMGVRGSECAMVEDSPRNLRPAKALGMTTVLVGSEPKQYVDYAVENVLEVGRVLNGLLSRRD